MANTSTHPCHSNFLCLHCFVPTGIDVITQKSSKILHNDCSYKMHTCEACNISNLVPLEGTHASKCDTSGSRKVGSFALESEGIIEFGMKTIDDDAGSIKGVENIKLNDTGNAGLSCGVGTAEKRSGNI